MLTLIAAKSWHILNLNDVLHTIPWYEIDLMKLNDRQQNSLLGAFQQSDSYEILAHVPHDITLMLCNASFGKVVVHNGIACHLKRPV